MSEERWIHALFHPKRAKTFDYRFCKQCWPTQPHENQCHDYITQCGALSKCFVGVCEAADGSTSSMVNHARSCKKSSHLVPEDLQRCRSSKEAKISKPDPEVLRGWSETMVLGELVPIRLVIPASSVCKGLAGKEVLLKTVEQQIDDIIQDIRELVKTGIEQNVRFSIGADAWKTKGRTRIRHFGAVILWWTDRNFEEHEACIGVQRMMGSRNGEAYRDLMLKALETVGLQPEDLLGGVSDHEGAIRRGIRLLGIPGIGCGCHAVQLIAEHSLPPFKKKKPVQPQVQEESSSSEAEGEAEETDQTEDLESEAGDPSSAAPASGPAAAARPPGGPQDARRREIQRMMEPIVKRMRETVKFFTKNEAAADALELDAKHNGKELVAFATETECRWSSTLLSWITVIRNAEAVNLTIHLNKKERQYPPLLGEDVIRNMVHICCVMEPIRRATLLYESDFGKGTASSYLVIWHKLKASFSETTRTLTMPTDLRPKWGQTMQRRDLCYLADKLFKFYREEVDMVFKKHMLADTNKLLQMATYLDPRYKRHECILPDVEATRTLIAKWARENHESRPGLAEHFRRRALRPDARDHDSLASLMVPVVTARGRGARGRGRARARGRGKIRPGDTEEPTFPIGSAAKAASSSGPEPPAPRRSKRILARKSSADEYVHGQDEQEMPDAEADQMDQDIKKLIDDELIRYGTAAPQAMSTDPRMWWRAHAHEIANLSGIAMWMFSIPPSSAALERLFSSAGVIISPRRARMSAKRAGRFLLGHFNVRHGINGDQAKRRRLESS